MGPDDDLAARDPGAETRLVLWGLAAGVTMLLALVALFLTGEGDAPATAALVDPIETGSIGTIRSDVPQPSALAGEVGRLRRAVAILEQRNEELSRRLLALERGARPDAAAPLYGVELGTFERASDVGDEWTRLRAVIPSLDRLLAAAAERNLGDRVEQVLVAGPFASAAEAAARCGELTASGLACIPTLWGGVPLPPP